MRYKMIDLFAGCGGLEDGFLQEPSAATDAYLPDFYMEGV